MAPESSPDESAARAGWALGLAIGLGVGVSLGAALHNIGVGIAIGAGIGTAFAVAFSNGMRKRARSAAFARDARSRGILVIGEALVDRVGETGEEFPGGSPANVALTLGRLGGRPRLLTALGEDESGERIRKQLTAAGVFVDAVRAERTSSATAHLADDGAASYEFDLTWDLGGAEDDGLVDHVHTGSIASFLPPGADDVARILDGYRGRATVSYDPNIRPSLIDDPDAVRRRVEAFAARADVIKLSDEDAAWLAPGEDLAARWHAQHAPLVILTRGARGARVYLRGEQFELPALAVDVVDTVGAGDAFTGALLAALRGKDLLGLRSKIEEASREEIEDAVEFALRVAAVTVSRRGANPPTRDELDPAD